MEDPARTDDGGRVRVDPWPSEGPLLVLVLLIGFCAVTVITFVFVIWSSGPDQKDQTDDIFYVSKRGFFR